MNRRRKLGDSPGLKNTPRKMVAAAEDCSSVVESGKRRLRSARRSGFSRAGDGPPQPMPRREQLPVAASCSKSNPEEKYETPKRVLKMDLLSSTFSSPNDPDGQNDIFWDQNSPMTKQLGKGRRTKIYTTDSDEISHIVNRIAPQDEKRITDSMLGVWIGEAAIPCTPNVAKGKSKAKVSCTKLKTQNQEEELMKLAKQFDKNMEELDVIQEQNKQNHDFIQMISEAETLNNNYKDNVQMQLLYDIPEINNAIIKKPMKGNTKVSVGNDQYISQMPFDQNAEAAFNAIFDASTQKCSGQLSQDRSDDFWNTITTFGKKSVLKEEKIITNKTQVTEKLPAKPPTSLSHQAGTPGRAKSYVTSNTKEPKAFNKHTDTFTTGDFEEDWENLLNSEPFVTQNVEISELFLAPEMAQIVNQKEICTINTKNDKSNSRMNISLDAGFRDSKILLDVSSKTPTSVLIDTGKYRFSPDSNDKPNKLLSIGNKVKFEKSFNKNLSIQDKTQDCSVAPDSTKVKEDIHTKFISNVNASQKKSTMNTGYSDEQKNKSIFNQSFKTHSNIVPFDCATLNNANQTNASNFRSFLDDWNDPSFANEIVKAYHQLENTWEADDVEDDLLYQACDDIERLTQQQDMRNDSKTLGSMLEINNSSKHGDKNMFTTSKQGNQLVQPVPLSLSSVSGQPSSLADRSQKNKSVKMQKGEICGNSPSFVGTTANVDCLINSLPWNNTDVPVQVRSSRSVLTRSSNSNVNSDQKSTQVASYEKKLDTRPLSHGTIKDEAQSDRNSTVRFSKYTFTKIKNSPVLSQINQNCITGSISDTKITQTLEKNRTVNSLCEKAVQQQSLMKPESLKQSPKEEEEKNRKYSPEEIQKKRQEALVRRMAKAQASTMRAAPT